MPRTLPIGHSMRIACGHTLTGLGLAVRRVSPYAALAVLAVLIIAAPWGPGSAAGTAWAAGLALASLVAVRVLAVGFGAAGWLTFPSEHRNLLSELAARGTLPEPGAKSQDLTPTA